MSGQRTKAVGGMVFFGFCVVMLAVLRSAPAQSETESRYQPDKVGKWHPGGISVDDGEAYGPAEQEHNIFLQKLQKLVAVFREAKTLKPPVGVEAGSGVGINWGFSWNLDETNPRPDVPVKGHVSISLSPYIINAVGRLDVDSGNPASLWIFVNDLEHIFTGTRETGKEVWEDGYGISSNTSMEDEQGSFFYAPQAAGVLQGRPLYDCDAVVFTKIQKPPWIPVTRERFLRHAMDWAQKSAKAEQEMLNEQKRSLAQLDKADREEMEQRLNQNRLQSKQTAADHPGWLRMLPGEYLKALKAELASLTPQERASQAYLGDWKTGLRASGLVESNEAEARPVVSVNPEFFNKSLPRAAFQSIVVIGLGSAEEARRHSKKPDPAQLRILELKDALDWNKVLALLD